MPKIKILVWWTYKLRRGPHETFETEGPVQVNGEEVRFPEKVGNARVLNMRVVERLELHLEQ